MRHKDQLSKFPVLDHAEIENGDSESYPSA
jgi:hypothetical protein